MRGAMDMKIYAAGLCLAVIAVTAISAAPAAAAAKKKQYVYTAAPDPPVGRPRARVTVAPRAFLDAGTEVLPGERKFTDYAFPTGSYSMPLSVVPSEGGAGGAGPGRRAGAVRFSGAAIIRTVGTSALSARRSRRCSARSAPAVTAQ